ncbi:MAG: peptide MFS transporter [Bacteroidales bacterium]|jgi:POT family proton-dependent oligopeptide transporter|nr:peptide MFS transporter [Bacteroidales bacterium]
MFKDHPKGLFVAFFTNMGERFGFYTMMAILVYFLQAKFGLGAEKAGDIYSWFYFAIYALALLGGIVADATRKYKSIIAIGQVIMFVGYVLMAMPSLSQTATIASLFIIALGNGLFKGNLQAVVGQLYDNPKYDKVRDNAFLIFYMGINVGAFFAPFAAKGVRNWWLKTIGYNHDAGLPAMCHQFKDGTLNTADLGVFQSAADHATIGGSVTDLGVFADKYIDVFSVGYHWAFGIAAGAMIISLIAYMFFNKHLPTKQKVEGEATITLREKPLAIPVALVAGAISAVLISFVKDLGTGAAIGLFVGFVTWIVMIATKEEKQRVVSLLLVFFVVIFFWMGFHQNGLTMSWFARDYTKPMVDRYTFMFFELKNILAVIAFIAGIVMLAGKNATSKSRIAGAAMVVVGGFFSVLFCTQAAESNAISPEVFQSFNPLFIVSLTFVVIGAFAWMNKKGIEPSTPKKIGIGMVIAALGFVVMIVGSYNLISPVDLIEKDAAGVILNTSPVPDMSKVMPYWLMSSYLILTFAELFLSPMGLSFVSKVAPRRFQGVMQGGWLLATAVGNKLLFIGSFFWERIQLWQLWAIFVVTCLLSAAFIFSIIKRLERSTKGKYQIV